MVICKFTKIDSAVYVPHLDLLRDIGRAVRRADLQIGFSEGFNPHMLLYFSQPLPLGMGSLAEYFCADSSEDPSVFADRINKNLIRGVRILSAATTAKASVHALITHAAYRYRFKGEMTQAAADSITEKQRLEIPIKTKKGESTADVRDRIYSLTVRDGELTAVLGCGRNNLRADSFGNYLSREFFGGKDYEVIKCGAYMSAEKGLADVDEFYGLKEKTESSVNTILGIR